MYFSINDNVPDFTLFLSIFRNNLGVEDRGKGMGARAEQRKAKTWKSKCAKNGLR